MATITLSSKNQTTLPVEMVRALGLKAGDKLDVELIDGRLVIWPKPASYTDYFLGSMKGFWGSKEEIDRYIAEVRYGWEIDALRDALSLDEQLRAVYDATSFKEARSATQIAQKLGIGWEHVNQCLTKLKELDAVKRLEHPTKKAEPYYRRIP